jgi:hypothetical protein
MNRAHPSITNAHTHIDTHKHTQALTHIKYTCMHTCAQSHQTLHDVTASAAAQARPAASETEARKEHRIMDRGRGMAAGFRLIWHSAFYRKLLLVWIIISMTWEGSQVRTKKWASCCFELVYAQLRSLKLTLFHSWAFGTGVGLLW